MLGRHSPEAIGEKWVDCAHNAELERRVIERTADLDTVDRDLRECIEGAVKTLAVRAHQKGRELTCDSRTGRIERPAFRKPTVSTSGSMRHAA